MNSNKTLKRATYVPPCERHGHSGGPAQGDITCLGYARFLPGCERIGAPSVQRVHYILDPEMALALGTVKWFDLSRGYGFIAPDNGSKEIFVHMSALTRVGMTMLVEGQKVEYQAVVTKRGGHARAEKLKVAQ
jgi:CspA family cold shock protein